MNHRSDTDFQNEGNISKMEELKHSYQNAWELKIKYPKESQNLKNQNENKDEPQKWHRFLEWV